MEFICPNCGRPNERFYLMFDCRVKFYHLDGQGHFANGRDDILHALERSFPDRPARQEEFCKATAECPSCNKVSYALIDYGIDNENCYSPQSYRLIGLFNTREKRDAAREKFDLLSGIE